MTTVTEAAAVLAKAAAYDPVFSKPNPAMVAAWAEAFTEYGLCVEDLLAAVTKHYSESSERVMPVHIIRHARALRRDRADRNVVRALTAGSDGKVPMPERIRTQIAELTRRWSIEP